MTTPTEGSNGNPKQEHTQTLKQLYFYLTEGCNLACRHCWLAPKFDPNADRYPTLPVEIFETAIKEALLLGLTGVRLTGGEPLMHPHILDLLTIVRREELALTIETNGLLCTPEVAAEIAKSAGAFVSVSLDGADAETYEWVRGVKGSYQAALNSIRNLVNVGIHPQIIMSVMRVNVDQIESMVRLAEDLSAGSIKFNVIQPIGRGEKMQASTSGLDVAQYVQLGHKVDLELAPSTGLKLHFDYPMAFRPLSRIAEDGASRCGILGIMGVIASGHYALCGIGEHVPELIFGQVGVDSLEAIWRDHPGLRELHEGLPARLSGVCQACLMKHQCLGSCIAQNFYRTHDLWAPFWFCEEAERLGLFPASRLGAGTS